MSEAKLILLGKEGEESANATDGREGMSSTSRIRDILLYVFITKMKLRKREKIYLFNMHHTEKQSLIGTRHNVR